MRDTLTALAGAVILILVAALAAPPFIDWTGRRALIDRAITASIGVPARSEGRIEVRFLPYPRLRLDQLDFGESPDRPSLDLRFVKAELALAPLLKGEFRFTKTRIGRAELKLPVTQGDAAMLPGSLAEALGGRDLVIEDLRVRQALLTTQVPATGRTDQLAAEALAVKAPSLAGPWQVEGTSGGAPFRLASTAIRADGATVKLSSGGERGSRFEVDARVVLKPVEGGAPGPGGLRAMIPEAEGSARLVVGPAAQGQEVVLPFTLGGKFKARGPLALFEGVNAEIDPAGQAVRLAGSGQFDLRSGRAGLSLESRRLNLDALIHSSAGQATVARALSGGAVLPVMLDLDLKVENPTLGSEDWSDLRFRGTFDRGGGLVLRGLTATAPGPAKVAASGEFDVTPSPRPSPRFDGHLDVDAAHSGGLARLLRRLGAEGPALDLLDGRPVRAAADVSAGDGNLSLRGLDLALGEARVSGQARYARAGAGGRGRLDADLQARALDIAELPPVGGLLPSLERHDVGLTIRARDLRYGPAGRSGNGTLSASIQSDGASLVVDRLDIADLAGASARLSGRIAPDGSGRIAGHVGAASAAPLLALLDRVWIPEARLLPAFLREGALDLDVSLEREAGEADTLRTTAKGTAAGTSIDGSLLSRGGRLDALDATLAAPRAGPWFGRDDIAALRQPASLTLKARREGAGPLGMSVTGRLAGLDLSTVAPLRIAADASLPDSGTLRAVTADAAPFLTLAGSAMPARAPLPADLTVALSRKGADLHAEASGRLAESDLSASLDRRPDGALAGKASLGTLSLPGLAAALLLPIDPGSTASDAAGWSEARFRTAPGHPRADLSLTVARLDLGRGLIARDAAFELALDGGALGLKNLSGSLAGGRLTGAATIARQGANATVSGEGGLSDAAIADLAAGTPIRGRVSLSLRYSGSGDSAASLMSNLGGSGEITLADLVVPGADPASLDRALTRALAEDDPLREGRLASVLSGELDAGPLSARGPVTTPVTLVGGSLRSGPVELDLGPARWSGGLTLDLRQRRIESRGTLVAAAAPKGWSGGRPSLQLGLSGPLSAPRREIEPGALANGLAALVLQRELEKIEQFEADQAERQRRRARIEMDQARAAALKAAAEKAAQERAAQEKAAAEKAARERAAAEEQARAARLRAQQAAAEEQARQARERQTAEDERRVRGEPPAEPLDIRPPQP